MPQGPYSMPQLQYNLFLRTQTNTSQGAYNMPQHQYDLLRPQTNMPQGP
jgi:hypothetical protein